MKQKFFLMGVLSLTFISQLALGPQKAGAIAAAPDKKDYVLFVEVKVKPATVLDFKRALLSIVGPTRTEDGNLSYSVYQSPTDPTDFMVYEHWRSEEDHTRHLQGQGFKNYSQIVSPLIEDGYPTWKKMIDLSDGLLRDL